MTEDFLHYIWKFQRFDKSKLQTQQGEKITIVHPGYHNDDAGPDFQESKIYIDERLWAGQVEIHLSSSDWYRHQHQDDSAYGNVILHVVYEHDREVYLPASQQYIPTLELKGRFDEYLYWRYEQLVQGQDTIVCGPQMAQVRDISLESMLERVLVERLQSKNDLLRKLLKDNAGDWDETFYQWMAYGFGLKVNTEPMQMLARLVPQRFITRLTAGHRQCEALLLGTSGLLAAEEEDEYLRELRWEYQLLQRKYDLRPMEARHWKYSRLRPPAFPDLRIAQFAALWSHHNRLLSVILGTGNLKDLRALFQISATSYWADHYRLGRPAGAHSPSPGDKFVNLLIINVVAPFLYTYGAQKSEYFYQQRALDILDQMPPEHNKVTREYEALGLSNQSSFYSQAFLQLFRFYCSPRKCLNCAIGNQLLKSE